MNSKKKQKRVLRQIVDVSFLDILAQNEVEITIKDYKDCYCKESNNKNDYINTLKK